MVLLLPEMFTRTTPVLRRSSSFKGWPNDIHTQAINTKRMSSSSPNHTIISPLKHVQSLPNMPTPPYASPPTMKSVHVHIPVQSPPSHRAHRTTPHRTTPHPTTPHPRSTLRPSRTTSSSVEPSPSSIPCATSPVATPTRPPLLRRVVTPTRPSLLRRTAAHMDGTTFERVTRRRLLSPHPTTSSSTTTLPAPPPSPTTPKQKRTPRRFTFAPIHVLTSQLRDVSVTEMEHEMLRRQEEQENVKPPAIDLVQWWSERESPIWQPPPALHTLIEDDWEEQHQQHHILPQTHTSFTSSTSASTSTSTTSSRTPLRPPPILLPHTIGAAPPFQYMPITPTRSPDLQLHSPPICHEQDIATALLSPSFAQLSMDVDLMATLPQGWQPQEMSRLTPSPTTTTTTTTTTTSTWTPHAIDEISQEIGQWINMDTQ